MTRFFIDQIHTREPKWANLSESGAELGMGDLLTFRMALASNLFDRGVYRPVMGDEFAVPEWRVMGLLQHHAPIAAHEIVNVSLMHKGQLSRALAALESRGYVVRTPDPEHGRRQIIDLSEKGRQAFGERFREAQKVHAAWLRVLSAEERGLLEAMLNKLTLAAHEQSKHSLEEDA